MVEIKGLAITAGSRPTFSASSGREQPTHLANTTTNRMVRHTTRHTSGVTAALPSSSRSTSSIFTKLAPARHTPHSSDTRSSFYTWARQMVGCYMLYPGFVIASVFSDLIVVNYVQQRPWSVVLMVIFSFILKLTMLATVKATVNKWL